MIKFLKRLFYIKRSKFQTQIQDELLGFWENDADDGSGLHAIWGYGIEFLEDGKGFDIAWGQEFEQSERNKPINWKRLSETSIRIKLESEGSWRTVEYEITDHIGAYETKWWKIVEKGASGFWTAPEPLFKKRS